MSVGKHVVSVAGVDHICTRSSIFFFFVVVVAVVDISKKRTERNVVVFVFPLV